VPITALTTSDTFATWYTRINSLVTDANTGASNIRDDDGDTQIQVEESPDEDIIRFDIAGTEHLLLSAASSTMVTLSTGSADAADNRLFQIMGGGGTAGVTRGAYINLYGNEQAAGTGSLQFFAGNVSGGNILFTTDSAVDRLTIAGGAGGEIVVNNTGGSYDFRIETDNDAYMLFVDGGKDALVFGSNTDVSSTDTPFLINYRARTASAGTDFAHLKIASSNAITIPSGTTTLAAGMHIAIPNWTATGTITSTASLYIAGAATEGTNDYALWVDAGATRLDGSLDIGSSTAVTGTLDEDNMASDSAVKLATQQSIKAYVDTAAPYGPLDEDDMASDSAVKLATQQSIKAYVDNAAPFPSGTEMVFHQAAPPTGWTKSADNDQVLRVVSGGTGGSGSGGSNSIVGGTSTSGAGSAHTHTGPSHTHTGPSHTHTGPSHTHTGPSHTHTVTSLSLPLLSFAGPSHTHGVTALTSSGDGFEYSNYDAFDPGAGANYTLDTAAGSVTGTSGGSSGSTAAGGTGATGSSGTAATGSSGTGATNAAGTGATGSESSHTHVVTPAIKYRDVIIAALD
jgi:hypothetical protein